MNIEAIGVVRSPLEQRAQAPLQGDEGAPEATVELEPRFGAGLDGVVAGMRVVVVTWLNRADRAVLRVHPRGDSAREPMGVFATRSPDRPNPIGLHVVEVLAVDGTSLRVADLEALDGTPVLDLKVVLASDATRR